MGPRQTGKTTLLHALFDGEMWAYEMKWSPKAKTSFSKTFTQAYPEHELRLIHRDNFYEWLGEGG